jgi:hypothetical protein
MRWPIPKAAREKIVKRYENGEKQLSEFRLRGKLVAAAKRDPTLPPLRVEDDSPARGPSQSGR